jgi:hypothetical protein
VPVAEIVAKMREDAGRWHWPAFDQECAGPRTPLSPVPIREVFPPCREDREDRGAGSGGSKIRGFGGVEGV